MNAGYDPELVQLGYTPSQIRIAEVAVMLGFSEQKTYTDARAGRFPKVKVGRSIVIPITPFEEWLNGIHSPCREN